MEKCTFKICPRQSGKTSRIINESINYAMIGKVMIIVYNNGIKQIIKDTLEWKFSFLTPKLKNIYENNINIITFKEVENDYKKIMGYVNYLFIDEYMFFPEKIQGELYNKIKTLPNIKYVHIETTPQRIFDECLVKTIDLIKYNHSKFNLNMFDESLRNDAYYLYNNFLTDENTKLIIIYEEKKRIYSPEQFESEYLGKFYK